MSVQYQENLGLDIQTEYVIIDSKDRNSNSESSSNFTVDLSSYPIRSKAFKIKKIAIPFTWYNIEEDKTIVIGAESGTIPAGSYSIDHLLLKIESVTSGFLSTVTTDFDDNSLHVTLTLSSSATLSGTILERLGFSEDSYSADTEFTAESIPKLVYANYLTLHSKKLSKYISTKIHSDGRSNLLLQIPVTGAQTEMIVFEPQTEEIYNFNVCDDIRSIDFILRHSDGRILDLNNMDMSVELTFYK